MLEPCSDSSSDEESFASEDDCSVNNDTVITDQQNISTVKSMSDFSENEETDDSDDNDDLSSSDEDMPLIEHDNDSGKSSQALWKNDASLDEMMKMRDKVGIKEFNKKVFGSKKKQFNLLNKKANLKKFKRENKNRPPEMSSKIKVPFVRQVVSVKQKRTPRDPRFDDLCGSQFDEGTFNQSYEFLDDIREREIQELHKMLDETVEPIRKRKLAYLLQRMKNQQHAKKFRAMERDVEKEWYKEEIAKVEKGIKRPHYLSKKEKKELVKKKHTENLKESGKLVKAEARREKRLRGKQLKKMPKRRHLEVS